MTQNAYNVSTPLRVGSLTADPANPSNGLIYYNTTSNNFRIYVNGAWQNISVAAAGAAWVTKIANYTASSGDMLIADTSAAPFAVTLPASPALGATVEITDGGGSWLTNNLTVNGNGSNILGSNTAFTANVNNATITFVYYNVSRGWLVIQG